MIIEDSLLKLADTNNSINCDQHGFQKKFMHYTTVELCECQHDWNAKIDNSAETDVIYLNSSKAFDNVPHK